MSFMNAFERGDGENPCPCGYKTKFSDSRIGDSGCIYLILPNRDGQFADYF